MQGKITEMIKNFNYNRVNNCYYGKCHEALIGEWINWWLENGEKSHERRIINPAVQAYYNGRKYYGDLLFFEKNNKSKSYKAVGVAEIENPKSKYLSKLLSKLKSLNAYIYAKGVNNQKKFPDLEFVLLSAIQVVDEEGFITNSHLALYEKLRKKIIEYSKSKESEGVYWIFYQMKLKKHPEFTDDSFDIDYVEDVETFWYYYSFEDKPNYLIAKNGKIIRKDFD